MYISYFLHVDRNPYLLGIIISHKSAYLRVDPVGYIPYCTCDINFGCKYCTTVRGIASLHLGLTNMNILQKPQQIRYVR